MSTFKNPVTGQILEAPDTEANRSRMLESGFVPVERAVASQEREKDVAETARLSSYDNPTDEALTALEAFGETASLGFVRPGEHGKIRREVNPLASATGTVAGIAATLPIPTGGTAAAGGFVSRAGQVLNIGGELAAKAVAGTGARAIAARGAIEGATYGGLDWMGSVIHGDPATVEGLVSQVGLGGVLGGGIGVLAGRAAAKADVQRTVADGIDAAATRFGEEQGAKHAAKVVQKAAKERGPLEKLVTEAQDEYYSATSRVSAADAAVGKTASEFDDVARTQKAAAASEDAAHKAIGEEYDAVFAPHVQKAQADLESELQRLVSERNSFPNFQASAAARTGSQAADEVGRITMESGLKGATKKEADRLRIELANHGDKPLTEDLQRRLYNITGGGTQAQRVATPLDGPIAELEDALRYVSSFPGARAATGASGTIPGLRLQSYSDEAFDIVRNGVGKTFSPQIQAVVDRAKLGMAENIVSRLGIDNPNVDNLIVDGVTAARSRVSQAGRKWTLDPEKDLRSARATRSQAASAAEVAHKRLSEQGTLLASLDDDIAKRASETFKKQAMGAREGYLNKVVQEGDVGGKQGGWFTRLIARRFGASFGAQLAGWHFGGPTGWMVLNRIFDKGAGQAAGEVVSVTRRQIMETARLKAMLLDKSSKRLIKTGEAASRLSPRAMREDFEATRDHIANMTVASDSLGFRAGDEIRTFSPEMADMLHETVMRGLNHLAETMPKDPGTMVDWAPSEMEMRAWGHRVEAVFRPMQALEKVASGAGTAEHIQSLRAVYPNLVSRVAQSLADVDPRTLSPNKRLAFSLLTGMPASAHYDPKTVAGIQARMAAQRQQPQQQGSSGGGGGRPAPTATGNSNATMADRVTER